VTVKYKTAFRLALRAIGVLIVAQALPSLVTALVTLGLNFNDVVSMASTGGWYLTMAGQAVLAIAVGLYLFFRGNWIVNLAIPSNRPYCHECAYELTGLAAQGICPECGTPYRPDGSSRSLQGNASLTGGAPPE
jgi:hypothetical protein